MEEFFFLSGANRPLGTFCDSVNRINKLLLATGPAVPQWELDYPSLPLTALYCVCQCRISVTLFSLHTNVFVLKLFKFSSAPYNPFKNTNLLCKRILIQFRFATRILYNFPTKNCISLLFGSINTLFLTLLRISEAECQSNAWTLPLLMYLKWCINKINTPLICWVHTRLLKHCNPIKRDLFLFYISYTHS